MIDWRQKHYRSKRTFVITVGDVLECLDCFPDDCPVMSEVLIDIDWDGGVKSEPCNMDALDIVDYGDAVIVYLHVDYNSFLLDSVEEQNAVRSSAYFNGVSK